MTETAFDQYINEMIEDVDELDEDNPLHGYRSAAEFKRKDPIGYSVAKDEYYAKK